MRKLKPYLYVLWVVVAVVIVVVYTFGGRVLIEPRETFERNVIAAGYKALFMCSGVFIAGRDPDDIRAEEFAFASPDFSAPGDATVDYDAQTATGTSARGLIARVAVYREPQGCTLMGAGAGPEEIAAVPTVPVPRPDGDPDLIQWPDGDRLPATPLPTGIDMEALGAAIDRAFDGRSYPDLERAWKPDTKTLGVVVVYQGRLIAERYAPGHGMHTQYRTWSTAKSFTNALVGTRVLAGALAIRAPAPFPAWQSPGDPHASITLANLLHMSSGLTCGSGEGRSMMVYFGGGLDAVSEGLNREVEAPAGTRWCYENFDAILNAYAVKRSLDDDLGASLTYPYEALLNKIGMRDTVLETDNFGNFIMSSQIWTTPRDLARFAMLYLNDGVWNGERILPEGWVEFTRTRAPAYADEVQGLGYGAQFWLFDRNDRLPDDTFTTAGHQGQYATIIPSRNAVVVRTGMMYFDQQAFVADVLDALPGGGAGPAGN